MEVPSKDSAAIADLIYFYQTSSSDEDSPKVCQVSYSSAPVTDDNDDIRLQCPSCPLTVWPWLRQCSSHFTIGLMYYSSGLMSAMLLQAVCFMDCFYSAAEGMFITSSSLKLPEHMQRASLLQAKRSLRCSLHMLRQFRS